MRERITMQTLNQSKPAATAIDPSYQYMQKSATAMGQKYQTATKTNNAVIADEVRKGLTSELNIKKMATEMTKVTAPNSSAMETSGGLNTRMTNRNSIDRPMTKANDYGSVVSPDSPMKP